MSDIRISRRQLGALAGAFQITALPDLAQSPPTPLRTGIAAPRIEVINPKLIALRFNPQLIHDRHITVEATRGKVTAAAGIEFNYRLPVPYWLEKARPRNFEFIAEISTPGSPVQIALNGASTTVPLQNEPNRARSPQQFSIPAQPTPEIEVRVKSGNGVTIYGAGAGQLDFDPVILVSTIDPVPHPTGWSMNENSGTTLPPLEPLFDYDIRDTSITLGGDGSFYLTGTTGSPDMWAVTSELQLWKSPDLTTWTTVVEKPRARSVVWSVDRDGTWEKLVALRDGAPFRPLWAPEIHFLKGTYWFTYSLPNRGIGLLKSATGKPEGPYQKAFAVDRPIANGIDASLFEDTDGRIYFLYGGGRIALIKDDMSALAEPFRQLAPSEGGAPYVGFEGVYMFKANGRYYLGAADFVFGDYHCYVASADSIYGPYSARYLAVPHGGHNTFFTDKRGNWWSSFFGNDSHAPFLERPAALPLQFSPEGRVQVKGG